MGGVDDWVERWDAGCDLLRVRVATYADGLDEVIEAGLRTGDPLPSTDEPAHHGAAEDHQRRVAQHPHRLVLRAVRRRRSARRSRPARPTSPRPSCTALLARAHMSGLEVATHAIGDAAVAAALDAYAATGARGSIEHAQLIGRDDVRRIAELGLRASVQPGHLLDDRDLTELIWPGRGERSLRVPLDARRRRAAAARVGRPGLTAGPLAGDGGRGAPQRRRPASLAPRAGADRARGAGRVGRRPADGGRRLPRRPGAARPGPAGPARRPGGRRQGAARDRAWR